MAQQGAALQNYNNELVKVLEELCERRQRLEQEIEMDKREKQKLDSQLAQLTAKSNALGENARRRRTS